jgi:hypothetical protein
MEPTLNTATDGLVFFPQNILHYYKLHIAQESTKCEIQFGGIPSQKSEVLLASPVEC